MSVEAPFRVRQLPQSYDYGSTEFGPNVAYGSGEIGTQEQRLEFARKMHRRPHNFMECERVLRTILVGDQVGLIAGAAIYWMRHPDVLNEWDRLDEEKVEIEEGLPSKQKLARDVYNIGLNEQIDADDRLKAFRLYGEVQGHIGVKGSSVTNIDARSVILVPRRSSRVDDPEREAKVIESQALLVKDAKQPNRR